MVVDKNQPLLCPSAQPEMKEARILGVVGGSSEAPELAYLNEHLPVTEELLATAAPAQAFAGLSRCRTL